MGGGSAPRPDTAITLSISKLAALLGIKPTLLKDILGTTQVELRDQPKIIAGGIDTERDMGFWTFFNSIGSIPISDIPRERNLHTYRRKFLNGGVNDGHHSIKIEPASNSILSVYFMSITNKDTVNRTVIATLYTAGAGKITDIFNASTAATGNLVFPRNPTAADLIDGDKPMIFTDELELYGACLSVAVSQDSEFFILYSYVGDAPTITETAPSGATVSDIA